MFGNTNLNHVDNLVLEFQDVPHSFANMYIYTTPYTHATY
jgi:hypothetical protein